MSNLMYMLKNFGRINHNVLKARIRLLNNGLSNEIMNPELYNLTIIAMASIQDLSNDLRNK